MKDIVIIGSGGFAREVKWLIDENNKVHNEWNVLGWISNEIPGTIIEGLPVLGDDSWIENCKETINVVIGIGDGGIRKKVVEKYSSNRNVSFPNIISCDVAINDSIKMGKGCIVSKNCIFTVGIDIGDFLVCNLACTVGHDCRFGDFITLFPGAHISGNVTLENEVSVGTGANVIQGIKIGRNTFIGAGATVIGDIPPNCTAVGVPAKPLEKKHE